MWRRAEVRPGVPRFSPASPRHSCDLSGFDQLFREKVTLNFPAWEEVHPGHRACWESSRSTLTLCAGRCTTLNLLSMVTTSCLSYSSREVLQPISAVVCVNRGQPVAGCPDSLMGVSALLEPGAEVRSGHPWSGHERCPRSSCPPSFTSGPSKKTLPLPCSAAAMSGCNVHHGWGDPHQQSVHTVPLPLASLAGWSPSCMTVSVLPLSIYNSLLVFFSLSFFLKR